MRAGEDQEVNWPACMRALVENCYGGYVGHEFIPASSDPMESLRGAVVLCDVE